MTFCNKLIDNAHFFKWGGHLEGDNVQGIKSPIKFPDFLKHRPSAGQLIRKGA